jgi:hypothetical protein
MDAPHTSLFAVSEKARKPTEIMRVQRQCTRYHLYMGTNQMLIPNFGGSELSHTDVGFKDLTAVAVMLLGYNKMSSASQLDTCFTLVSCLAYSSTLKTFL